MVSKCFTIALIATMLSFFGEAANALELLGDKPKSVRSVSSVPNEQAITKAIWAPGVDDGFVPQGLTVADDLVLISSYQSTDPKVDRGPCKVFAVDTQTGRPAGAFNLPKDCGHAGGMVYIGKGILLASDTRRLYQIDLRQALKDGNADQALKSTVRLTGDLKGSFMDFDGTNIFIGSSEKTQEKAKGFYLSLDIFEKFKGKTIKEDIALNSIPVGTEGNGAAFDAQGNLWTASSNSKYGMLEKRDPKTGAVLAQYSQVIGIEDLGFDAQGRLWSVSEAGTIRWSKWTRTFPVIFQIDIGKLQPR